MAVPFKLPPNLSAAFAVMLVDLDQGSKEAMLVELFRQDQITHHQLARLLGLGTLPRPIAVSRSTTSTETSPPIRNTMPPSARLGVPKTRESSYRTPLPLNYLVLINAV